MSDEDDYEVMDIDSLVDAAHDGDAEAGNELFRRELAKLTAERGAALAALRLAKAALRNSEQRCHDCGPDAVSALAAIARLLPSEPTDPR